jgi:hypothetical protein
MISSFKHPFYFSILNKDATGRRASRESRKIDYGIYSATTSTIPKQIGAVH